MSAHEMKKSGLTVFLYFYAPKACIRKKINFYPGEKIKIELAKEQLKTVYPVLFVLDKKEGYRILHTQAGEKILVVIVPETGTFMSCKKINLFEEAVITAGSGFQNEIFYDCFAFISDKHIRIFKEEEKCVLEGMSGKEDEQTDGLYVNQEAVCGKYFLQKGDLIELFGLRILVLPQMLVCSSFYGNMRVTERRMSFLGKAVKTEERLKKKRGITESVLEEKALHDEEIELSLPEPERRERMPALFLSLGPSLTMILPVIFMGAAGSVMAGQIGTNYYITAAVMTVSSAVLSVFWGIINHLYKKKVSSRQAARRKEIYREYLKKMEDYLWECGRENQEILRQSYPSCQSFLPKEEEGGKIFWNKSGRQKELLFIRLGLGTIPFQVKIKLPKGQMQLNFDMLVQEAYELADKYRLLKEVPVGVELKEAGSIGFAGNLIYPVFLQFVVQLAAGYGSSDMKVAYFYHEDCQEEKKIAACMKWLPHVWQTGGKVRYLAGNERESGEIMPELMKELRKRSEGEEEDPKVFYIIIVADRELIKGEELYHFLRAERKKEGIYPLFLDKKKEKIQSLCSCLVVKEREHEEILLYGQGRLEKQSVCLETCSFCQAESYMRQLTGLFGNAENQKGARKEKVSFLDLFSCKKVEELHCQSRWYENKAGHRMKVPIGAGGGNRLIYLDVHEKFHGPHGLVAGTTGSGKSELLQTYLLSLSVSFSPEDINFFIIDYKGGGMGNTLCRLPHCAGVISNLSGRQIKRALVSIRSENTRRQKLFGMAGVNHVTDYAALYREGKVPEPVPHLFLVVDEFAELKKEEPEFMQEIISVSQVGRSLGVHLILATQKPAGTVDDKIWSNTRFRLCLRVSDKQDSFDMLHRPDAAYLTQAGSCYLQVGNHELYELFQAGYSGERYEKEKKTREGAFLVSATGRRFGESRKEKEKLPSQLDAVIDYVTQAAESAGYATARKLWMPELPDKLSLEEIDHEVLTERRDGNKQETFEAVKVCLGLCDDPKQQMQYPLYYRPDKEGNLCLCGAPAVGKSTFLQMILWQLCRKYSPYHVQFMLAGSDNAGVNCFEIMPHCLGNMRKKDDAECFFYHVERLFRERKEMLKGLSFLQYRKHQKEAGAFLFLIIDNYGGFRQMTEDCYQPFLEKLAGEGINYGIYLILTALNVGTGDIPLKMFEKIKVTLSLEMSDKVQYGDVLRQYHISALPKENVKGRGLWRTNDRILEFQVPLLNSQEDDYQRIQLIEEFGRKKNESPHEREFPHKFPVLPEKPLWGEMQRSFFKEEKESRRLPLGYQTDSGYIKALFLKQSFPFLISGGDRSGKRNLLSCLIEGLKHLKMKPVLFDRKGICKEIKGKQQQCILTDEQAFARWYKERYVEKTHLEEQNCLCICDLADFAGMFHEGEGTREVKKHFEKAVEENRLPVIALSHQGKEIEAAGTFLYELLVRHQWGIHLGGNAGNQRMLTFDDMSYMQLSKWEEPGMGYLKTGPGSKTLRIRIPLYEQEGKKDDSFRCTDHGNGSNL